MAAKRSPILGYNHNVRYRGLVFHVQTEDSGILSPHLFTHLFHGGVIVSTRKLVYDSGSAEDSIKSLMQAQHKAVLKDLKKGAFDDKIDAYLGNTPGLLPRGVEDPAEGRPSTGTMEPVSKPIAVPHDELALDDGSGPNIPLAATIQSLDILITDVALNAVPEVIVAGVTVPSAPPTMAEAVPVASTASPTSSRTRTAERTSGPMRAGTPLPFSPRGATPSGGLVAVRATPPPIPTSAHASPPLTPPPPMDSDPPTFVDHAAAVAAAMDAAKATIEMGPPMPSDFAEVHSSPEIEMMLEVDDDDDDNRAYPRAHRDTEVSSRVPVVPLSDGVPRARGGDSAPPLPPPPDRRVAAALPPGKSVTRPPAVAVVSRPLSNSDAGRHSESDAIEVYAPPPSSVPDPGAPAERPGQYSLRRSKPVAVPEPVRERERSAGVPVPAGLARPGQRSDRIRAVTPQTPPEPPTPPSRPTPNPASRSNMSSNMGSSMGSNMGRTDRPDVPPAPLRAPRTAPAPPPDAEPRSRHPQPTPARVTPSQPMPIPSRTSSTSSPVVMTRPAVIVGAPAKPPVQRVRKAREDEGRGFGQGLISEKSLDEVILAYLSEDAEEK